MKILVRYVAPIILVAALWAGCSEKKNDNADSSKGLKGKSGNGSIALAALESGKLDIAKRSAEAMLKSNTDIKSWNYGNIIYEANAILGRVALRQNDLEAARMYLLESGKTPGSPQLNSFGPRFILDRELLEKGEKVVVLEHLELVSKFWGNINRNYGGLPPGSAANSQRVDADNASKLAQWKKEIEEGKIPSDPQWK